MECEWRFSGRSSGQRREARTVRLPAWDTRLQRDHRHLKGLTEVRLPDFTGPDKLAGLPWARGRDLHQVYRTGRGQVGIIKTMMFLYCLNQRRLGFTH